MRPPRLVRLAVTLPLVVAFEVVLVVTSPVTLAIAAAVSTVQRSSRPVRTVALLVAYAAIELRTLLTIARGVDEWDALLVALLRSAYGAMRRTLGVPLVIEDGSPTPEELAAGDGVIVLARHCGPGDSVYLAWLLGVHYELSLHIVLKRALRAEPTIDIAADHLPLCFVGGRSGRARARIAEVAGGIGKGDALLLFPEGGNFTWARWQSAIDQLNANGYVERARRALRQTHTLPPRLGGAVAALSAAPRADVLLIAHSGFSDDGRGRPWWRLPVSRELAVRTMLIPAAQVPRDEAGIRAFVDEAWAAVDTWVEGHTNLLAFMARR